MYTYIYRNKTITNPLVPIELYPVEGLGKLRLLSQQSRPMARPDYLKVHGS